MKRYYRLLWKPTYPKPTKIKWHELEMEAVSITNEPLLIFGYEERSKHPGDKHIMDEKYEQGFVYGRWFSSNCTDGEPGFHHLSLLTEITETEFGAWKRMLTP